MVILDCGADGAGCPLPRRNDPPEARPVARFADRSELLAPIRLLASRILAGLDGQ